MQGFPERGGPGPGPGPNDLAHLQATMHAIELACASIQVLPPLIHLFVALLQFHSAKQGLILCGFLCFLKNC